MYIRSPFPSIFDLYIFIFVRSVVDIRGSAFGAIAATLYFY